jgi:hypothetical protein
MFGLFNPVDGIQVKFGNSPQFELRVFNCVLSPIQITVEEAVTSTSVQQLDWAFRN